MSYLVEAEATGPIEGEDAVVTPPRPPHRRVSVSLLFTLTVLIGTVVAIYVGFPPRHHVLMTEAVAQHREKDPAWDLVAPTPDQLRAFVVGAVGAKGVPLPAEGVAEGARRIEVLKKSTAVIRYRLGDAPVTYVVQIAGSVGPDTTETEDDLRVVAWQTGRFRFVMVGAGSAPDALKKSLK
jgi:hypothetical protein